MERKSMSDEVKAWAEIVKIPTYKIGAPNKNPMFLEKRVYQGSSGVVYPHAVIDRVFDEKEDKEYIALYLENRYLKIMILPEIGGRVQMALDKTNGYQFVYYNHVIKPALVGLAGPWISGGIEFNWPQHHRPSTFDPLDWKIETHEDGSQTVWCAEIEKMFRTKGMHGFTLHPECAYLEIRVQLYNCTSEPQTFLWWANPAVSVHDEYQSVFPPDVHAVMDHGKRDVSSFPIATGTYYKVNYAPGTDISRYKNIPVPTSYMAYHSDFDFMGDYDHRAEAGMLHIANHHIVPGKKQWTWGNGEFGQAWDRQLTDEDGPYIELMCGGYTDNQPDFSWIQPGEEKSFTQIFMPYKKIEPACNANEHAALSLDVKNNIAKFGIYTSSPRTVTVKLNCQGQTLYEKSATLDPEHTLFDSIILPTETKPQDVSLTIFAENSILLTYTPVSDETPDIPTPASPAQAPEEIESIEELFLNGLHLEQYRHATYAPEPYYLEALRRDPGDSRCNNAMGLLLYRRGKFIEAEAYFRKAIQRLTQRNPNPYDGEPYYNLGLTLKMQGRYNESLDAFHKAVWNAAWQDAAYFELARLASRKADFSQALDYIDRTLNRNGRHHKARHLKIGLLRRTGQVDAARAESTRSLMADPMEYGTLWERFLLDGDLAFEKIIRKKITTYVELALDYAHAGLFDEAIKLLEQVRSDPMAAYTLGWVLSQSGQDQAAVEAFRHASSLPSDYCFPNRLDDVIILTVAQRTNPQDARAPYYLGNFWYAHRRYDEAIACWENAQELDPNFPTAHRNLGLAYFNKRNDPQQALICFETAFALNPADARVFFELDQLYKELNRTPSERLVVLQKHLDLVEQRDDLAIEYVTLLNMLGHHDEAYQYLMRRNFHPWEGGEGKVSGQYITSLVESARRALARGEAHRAIESLAQAQTYPHNLGEGKLYGAQENNIFYYLGCAHEALGEHDLARQSFERAATGLSEPISAMFYNDQPPDMIFYQGLSNRKLGRAAEAQEIFNRLVNYGAAHIHDDVRIDYFAVSLPDFLVFEKDTHLINRAHCHYMMALGYMGLGNTQIAQQQFAEVLALDANHSGALIHRSFLAGNDDQMDEK
jgi:tetratricopeptide (TPR) repeat protein